MLSAIDAKVRHYYDPKLSKLAALIVSSIEKTTFLEWHTYDFYFNNYIRTHSKYNHKFKQLPFFKPHF